MKKGIIADVREKKAVLLYENGEFAIIRNKNYSVGQQVLLKQHSYSSIAAIAACFLLAAVIGGTSRMYYSPVSYIDIDINPSLRLEVNTFNRVLTITPLNDDARDLINKSGKLSKDIRECIIEITNKSEEYGYINSDNSEVDISVVSDRNKTIDSVKLCEQILADNDMIQMYVNVDSRDEFEKAKELNISVGRLKNIEKYCEVCGGSVDDNAKILKDKSNKEIRGAASPDSTENSVKIEENKAEKASGSTSLNEDVKKNNSSSENKGENSSNKNSNTSVNNEKKSSDSTSYSQNENKSDNSASDNNSKKESGQTNNSQEKSSSDKSSNAQKENKSKSKSENSKAQKNENTNKNSQK